MIQFGLGCLTDGMQLTKQRASFDLLAARIDSIRTPRRHPPIVIVSIGVAMLSIELFAEDESYKL